MKVDEFLKSDPIKKAKLDARLDTLANISEMYQRFAANLFAENSLTDNDWRELVEILLNDNLSIGKTTFLIRNFCRNDRKLKGKDAKVLNDIIYGRLVSFDVFCQLLIKLKYYSTLEEAKAYVRYQIGLDLGLMDEIRKSQQLGIYIMWSTFDPKGDDPFGDPMPDVEELISSLGLERVTSPYLLFEYKLPPNVGPKIPTICDSYAGKSWSRYFYRVGENAPYGMTTPTDTSLAKEGRPEVVHEVIKAENLVSPLRRV